MLFLIVAQETPRPSGGGGAGSLVLFLPLILLFYFFLIRPQRRQMRAQQDLQRGLEVGDEVETIAGIYGTIRRLDEQDAWVDVAEGTMLRMSRRAIRRRITEPGPQT